jgi:EAL domain-containing protein (putative c-di-GMP-specific phosphodiesterase class I)
MRSDFIPTDVAPPDFAPVDFAPSRYQRSAGPRAVAGERRRLQRDLATAAQFGRFALHYQPRAALATGVLIGAEALIRWPHRAQGMIAPSQFLPLAEENGQIVPIGGWMLRAACREARRWRDAWTVSVKVSLRQIDAGALLGQLAAALEESGLAPERLELELAEAQFATLDSEGLLTLAALRDLGVGLLLDEFGAGQAALGLLRRLPLTAVKLGRALVRGLPEDREDAAIAGAVIAVARALGLAIVADGIEHEAQRGWLAASGAEAGQGPLFGDPLAAERLPVRRLP